MPETTQQLLDERYGRTRSRRTRWVWAAVIAVAAAVVGLFAWTTVNATLDDVSAQATGYHVADARTVVIDFQVTAPAGRDVACALEALDADHGVVGWRIVQLPASDQAARAFRESIPTVALATTGLVNACWVT